MTGSVTNIKYSDYIYILIYCIYLAAPTSGTTSALDSKLISRTPKITGWWSNGTIILGGYPGVQQVVENPRREPKAASGWCRVLGDDPQIFFMTCSQSFNCKCSLGRPRKKLIDLIPCSLWIVFSMKHANQLTAQSALAVWNMFCLPAIWGSRTKQV